MRTVLAFALLLVVALAYPSAEVDWEDAEILALQGIEKRIVGGEVAKPNQIPYQVRLHLTKKVNGRLVSSLCGGAIVSNKVILTAAHCLKGAIGGTVYMGITDVRRNEPTRVVMQLKPQHFHIHEKYSPMLFENDIALIILPTAVKFNDAIKPISLPSASIGNLENRMGVISGYGKTGDRKGPSDNLRFVERKILPDIFCHYAFPRFKPTQVCVDGAQKKSACPGDSGGPLVITEADGTLVLAGVTSYGRMSCEMGSPAVYTRISSYLDWINKLTGIPVKK